MNLLFGFPTTPSKLVRTLLVRTFPSYFSDGPVPHCMVVDFKDALEESGYFHMQATKPDTLGEFPRISDSSMEIP